MTSPRKPWKQNAFLAVKGLAPLMFLFWLFLAMRQDANAVPSYSRQTGLPCSSCHLSPPELNAFGRKLELDGYTFATKPTITDDKDKKDHSAALQLLEAFPLSAVFDTSFTSTKQPQPTITQNGNFEFPQDVSLFLAGGWSNHIGSFVQVTYDAQAVTSAGITPTFASPRVMASCSASHSPSAQRSTTTRQSRSLWNSTAAWGFPFTSTDVAPSPTASALINGGLAQDVAGVGGYVMWNEHLYVARTIYRSQHIDGPQPNPGTGFGINVRGLAPYWRVAWQ